MNEANNLSYQITCESPSLCYATVQVSSHIVDFVYRQAVLSQKMVVSAPGFAKGAAPYEYISQVLKSTLMDHVKEFLLHYCVYSFLYSVLREQKIVMAGNPRLFSIDVHPGQTASYTFEITRIPPLNLLEWHYFPFKAPRRKNYKDLDRQVEMFIKDEKEQLKKNEADILAIGDWVLFEITLADNQSNPLADMPKETLWLKIGEEDVDEPLRTLFVGKKIGDQFCSDNPVLQEYFSTQLNTNYQFHVNVIDMVKHSFFCLEHFKKHFKLKTNKDLEHKLIEVFSYRNDISLRRSMAEESLKLLMNKHKFDVPNHLLLRQQQLLLDDIQTNPDFHVYRVQKDFQMRVRQLAEKQVKEVILIDHIAYNDNVAIADGEVKGYLNLLQRPRTKEFIYFEPPQSKRQGQETPIAGHVLKQTCLREKTLNHVIHHLTRQ